MKAIRVTKIIPVTFLGLTLFLYLFMSWHYREDFLFEVNPHAYSLLYERSQYGSGQEIIFDDELYAYAGYHYLTTGDISQVNVEHPPLGKYLIGISIILFNNPNVINIVYGFFLLWVSWKLADVFLQKIFLPSYSQVLASFVPFLLILEPVFWHNMLHSFLDLPLALFTLIFLLASIAEDVVLPVNKDIFLGVLLGMVASIKFPVLALILFGCWVLNESMKKDFFSQRIYQALLKRIVLVGVMAVLIFLLSYGPLFYKQGITGFIATQTRALTTHLSHVPEYPFGAVFQVLFFNRWPRWFEPGGFQQAPNWNWTWPIIGISFLISPWLFIRYFRYKETGRLIFLVSWTYLLFLSSRLFFPKYLFVLFPVSFIYLLAFFGIASNKNPDHIGRGKKRKAH